MTVFVDTSVLVAAMIQSELGHTESRTTITSQTCGIYAHGLAETFSALTGGRKSFRIRPSLASELLEDHFIPRLTITSLTPTKTLRAMRDAETRGIRGAAIFDYLHLVAARKSKARTPNTTTSSSSPSSSHFSAPNFSASPPQAPTPPLSAFHSPLSPRPFTPPNPLSTFLVPLLALHPSLLIPISAFPLPHPHRRPLPQLFHRLQNQPPIHLMHLQLGPNLRHQRHRQLPAQVLPKLLQPL